MSDSSQSTVTVNQNVGSFLHDFAGTIATSFIDFSTDQAVRWEAQL